MPTHAEVIEQLIADRDEARQFARSLLDFIQTTVGDKLFREEAKQYPWLTDEEEADAG
jgi:hypothetical protein